MQGFIGMHIDLNINNVLYHIFLAGPNASVNDDNPIPIGELPQHILDALLEKQYIRPI